jgi:ubiquitin carboxyl-terminal hydrolase 36/42
MNDESVTPNRGPPVSVKNAYILFYLQDKGQALEAVTAVPNHAVVSPKVSVVAGMKKRKVVENGDEDDEDTGVRTSHSSIGPQLPLLAPEPDGTDARCQRADSPDRQAVLVKKRIEAVSKAQGAIKDLVSYADSDAEPSEVNVGGEEKPTATIASSPAPALPPSSSPVLSSASVPAARFYGSSTPNTSLSVLKKRKSPDAESQEENKDHARKPLYFASPKSKGFISPATRNGYYSGPIKRKSYGAVNPYTRVAGSDNLSAVRRPDQFKYGKKNRRPHAI